MSDNMVERVARAMFSLNNYDVAWNEVENAWDEVEKFEHLAEARAAIEAMREPTEAMIASAQNYDDSTPGYCREWDFIWQAMIDEALKKPD